MFRNVPAPPPMASDRKMKNRPMGATNGHSEPLGIWMPSGTGPAGSGRGTRDAFRAPLWAHARMMSSTTRMISPRAAAGCTAATSPTGA